MSGNTKCPTEPRRFNTNPGFVHLYLLRLRAGGVPDVQLPHFFQSGTQTFSVKGLRAEMIWPINKNTYTVYAHKVFKMGAAFVRQDGVPPAAVNEQNNDFSLAKTFSFDVTKYVGKNHIVRYLDLEEQPSDQLLNQLTLVSFFQPACGDMGTPTAGLTGLIYKTAFTIDASSWGEYETA